MTWEVEEAEDGGSKLTVTSALKPGSKSAEAVRRRHRLHRVGSEDLHRDRGAADRPLSARTSTLDESARSACRHPRSLAHSSEGWFDVFMAVRPLVLVTAAVVMLAHGMRDGSAPNSRFRPHLARRP